VRRIDPAVPSGVPALTRGPHPRPDDGVCLMELTAYLAGAPHTDAPDCTHAVLAAVARVVNDGVSDDARSRLALLAPDLIHTSDTSRRATAGLVLTVCEPALVPAPPLLRPRIMRAVRRARRTLRKAEDADLSSPRELRSAASAAAAAAAALTIVTGSNRDDVLITLLKEALDTYRETTNPSPRPSQGYEQSGSVANARTRSAQTPSHEKS
jgi:hypothetical protein